MCPFTVSVIFSVTTSVRVIRKRAGFTLTQIATAAVEAAAAAAAEAAAAAAAAAAAVAAAAVAVSVAAAEAAVEATWKDNGLLHWH